MEKNRNKYNLVFTADVSDSIFQNDIFQLYNDYNKPFLSLFLEDNIIKNERYNRRWANL